MKAGGEDMRLRTVFAVGCEDAAFGQRAAAIDAEHLSEMTVRHMHEGRRQDSDRNQRYTGEPHQIDGDCIAEAFRQQRRRAGQQDRADYDADDQPEHDNLPRDSTAPQRLRRAVRKRPRAV